MLGVIQECGWEPLSGADWPSGEPGEFPVPDSQFGPLPCIYLFFYNLLLLFYIVVVVFVAYRMY